MNLQSVHHIAIIVSDHDRALDFYVKKLGFSVIRLNLTGVPMDLTGVLPDLIEVLLNSQQKKKSGMSGFFRESLLFPILHPGFKKAGKTGLY